MFRLCDEIHFRCSAVFGMMRYPFVEDPAEDRREDRRRSRPTPRRRNPREIETNSLVKVIDGDLSLDQEILVEVMETREDMCIPVDYLKVS